METITLGLYVVRGDNVYGSCGQHHQYHHALYINTHTHRAVVGEVDEERDEQLDLPNLRAAPLKSVMH